MRSLLSEERRLDLLRRQATNDADHMASVASRAEAVKSECVALSAEQVEELDVRVALRALMPIWDELVPREQERLLQLAIERIEYDPKTGDVELLLRHGAFSGGAP